MKIEWLDKTRTPPVLMVVNQRDFLRWRTARPELIDNPEAAARYAAMVMEIFANEYNEGNPPPPDYKTKESHKEREIRRAVDYLNKLPKHLRAGFDERFENASDTAKGHKQPLLPLQAEAQKHSIMDLVDHKLPPDDQAPNGPKKPRIGGVL